jgi:hypothetical protein
MNKDIVIISCHFNEDLSWLTNSPFKCVVSTNHPTYTGINVDEKLRASVNMGKEAAAYIRYIIEYYNDLPLHMAFIHGHEFAYHQNFPGTLFDAVARAKINEYHFISMNMTRKAPANADWIDASNIWEEHFKPFTNRSIFEPSAPIIEICAQFIVSREKVLSIPLEGWRHWLEMLEGKVETLQWYNLMPVLFEWVWHIIFGDPVVHTTSILEYYNNRYIEDPSIDVVMGRVNHDPGLTFIKAFKR